MTTSSLVARRRYLEKSSFTFAKATVRLGRPFLFEPFPGFALRDDPEDFDGFVRDVIEHPDVAYPEAELRFCHPPQSLDPAPAHPGWLVSQVGFQRIAELGTLLCGQRPKVFYCLRGENDLEPHSGQKIARNRRSNKAMHLSGRMRGVRAPGAVGRAAWRLWRCPASGRGIMLHGGRQVITGPLDPM
jgi:hypothetical protein